MPHIRGDPRLELFSPNPSYVNGVRRPGETVRNRLNLRGAEVPHELIPLDRFVLACTLESIRLVPGGISAELFGKGRNHPDNGIETRNNRPPHHAYRVFRASQFRLDHRSLRGVRMPFRINR
jgi:hypothetical protein